MNPTLDPEQLGLRDIHLPEVVGWWPLALGWWTLLLVTVVITVALIARYARHWRHRTAHRALRRAMAEIAAGADPSQCVLEASTILRRFAMTMADDSDEIAGLVGDGWIDYLDSRWDRVEFAGSLGQLLLSSPYQPSGVATSEESLALCQLCVDWVKVQSTRA